MTEEQQRLVFNGWLQQYKALLLKVVRAYAFTAMDRDDLFQEIAIQVWRSVPSFRQEAKVSTWLYRVSLNTAIGWTRKQRKHTASTQTLDDGVQILQENTAAKDDRLTWLYDEIARLDEIDKSLALLMLDGFSYEEMSGILGITGSNVGVKINRLKKHLVRRSKLLNDGI